MTLDEIFEKYNDPSLKFYRKLAHHKKSILKTNPNLTNDEWVAYMQTGAVDIEWLHGLKETVALYKKGVPFMGMDCFVESAAANDWELLEHD